MSTPRVRTWLAAAVLISAALAPVATGQYAMGDVTVAGVTMSTINPGCLLAVKPNGTVQTMTTAVPFLPMDLVAAPDNRSVLLFGFTNVTPGMVGKGMAVAPDGSVTSIFSSTVFFPGCADVDDGGQVILGDATTGALARFSPFQGSLTTLRQGLGGLIGCGIDLPSGDLIASRQGDICRITLPGANSVTTIASAGMTPVMAAGVHADPTTAGCVAILGTSLIHITTTGPSRVTTLYAGTSLPPLGGLDRDPRSGEFVFAAMGLTNNGHLLRYDPTCGAITTQAVLGMNLMPLAVAIAGSRHLASVVDAVPGQPVHLRVSSPAEPGAPYLAALSFGFRPGIDLGHGRRVHLNLDALFLTSLTNSGMFSGFQGTLDSRGEAIASIALPRLKALSGNRFFAAALTIAGGRISVISEPVGVTIR